MNSPESIQNEKNAYIDSNTLNSVIITELVSTG